ncbi:MAG: glucan biosynthesis protein G [Candidatus Binatia bacterium]
MHAAKILVVVFITILTTSLHAKEPFGFDSVADRAKKLAAEPFRAPPSIPEFLTRLSYDEYRDIRFDTKRSLWRERGNFQVQFVHPGLYYNYAVGINVVEGNEVRKLDFSPSLFTYGRNKFGDKIPADLGFAGFRIAFPLHRKGEFNHVMVFAGASYFRAVSKGEVFGLSARGVAIDTGLPNGEEFPFFKEFWLERPAPSAHEMKLHALLDSPSLTGAYSFTIQPGERTIVNVRARLFFRKPVKELGIAPLTSMFFFGEEKPRPPQDWRPEVHDSDGLLMHSGTGEWLWRPLGNPEKLRISYFEFNNPRGFGLLQRDRDFRNYQDLEARHELRPNAWVVPNGAWGRGIVKLVEIPSPNETNDNMVAYWLPRGLPPAGQPLDLVYRIYFDGNGPTDLLVGRVTATRIGAGDKEDWKRFVVDFEGGKIKTLPDSAPVKAVVTLGQNGQLMQQNVARNAVTGSWRLAFQVKPEKGKPLEMRAYLQSGKDILTETWSYQLE